MTVQAERDQDNRRAGKVGRDIELIRVAAGNE